MRVYSKLLAVALLGLGASTAQAALVQASGTGIFTTAVSGATTIDFESGHLGCGGYVSCTPAAPGVSFMIVNASTGQTAQPYGTSSYFLTVANPVSNGSATFNLGTLSDYFGIYWGSIDTYNSLTFIRNGLDLATYTGSQLAPLLADGNQTSYSSNRYINFYFNNSEVFDSIRIASSQYAFESDNHAFRPVPLPAAAWLLISGLAGLGVFGRRRTAA